jgi:hypothetical protein
LSSFILLVAFEFVLLTSKYQLTHRTAGAGAMNYYGA